jgi:uroporphyrinogen decarboxylase
MRQAGRYLPEYRALRDKHSFWEMVRTPALACEVTLQPLHRYDLDAAILFSDILIVPAALGLDVEYAAGGPRIRPLLRSAADVENLLRVDAARDFAYVRAALELVGREIPQQLGEERALIGFAGAPFTLTAYMLQGGPAKNVDEVKALALNHPELYGALAARVADTVADLLALQVDAGVDAVQIFDTWAGHLSPEDYERLAAPWTRHVIERLHERAGRRVPVIHYLRNCAGHLEAAAATGCDGLSVDTSLRLADARRRLPAGLFLQGNLDPAILRGPLEEIGPAVRAKIDAATSSGDDGFIFNVGQGLTPATPTEGVAALVQAVKGYGR